MKFRAVPGASSSTTPCWIRWDKQILGIKHDAYERKLKKFNVSWELIPEAKQDLNRISRLWNSWWIKTPNNFVLKMRIHGECSCQEKWQEALAALQQLEPEADVTLSKPSAGDHCFWYGSYHQLLHKWLVSEKCCVMFAKPGKNDTTLFIACSAMLSVTWGNYLQQRHQSLWWSNTVAACLAFDTPCEAHWSGVWSEVGKTTVFLMIVLSLVERFAWKVQAPNWSFYLHIGHFSMWKSCWVATSLDTLWRYQSPTVWTQHRLLRRDATRTRIRKQGKKTGVAGFLFVCLHISLRPPGI